MLKPVSGIRFSIGHKLNVRWWLSWADMDNSLAFFSYYFDFYTDAFNLYVFVNDYIETFVTDLFSGLTEARLFLTRPSQDTYTLNIPITFHFNL